MADLSALDAHDLTAVGAGVIVAIAVIGLVVAFFVQALVKRLIVLVVVAVLAFVVWQQRGHVRDRVNERTCDLSATFFGIHVTAPQSVLDKCRSRS